MQDALTLPHAWRNPLVITWTQSQNYLQNVLQIVMSAHQPQPVTNVVMVNLWMRQENAFLRAN